MIIKSAFIKPLLLISIFNFKSAFATSHRSVPDFNSDDFSITLSSYLESLDLDLKENISGMSSDDSVSELDFNSNFRPVNPECLLIIAQNYLASAESYREDLHTSSYIALQSLEKYLQVLESSLEEVYPEILGKQINRAYELTQQNPSGDIGRRGFRIYKKILPELESMAPEKKIKRHKFKYEKTSHSKRQEKRPRNHQVMSLPEDSRCCFPGFW